MEITAFWSLEENFLVEHLLQKSSMGFHQIQWRFPPVGKKDWIGENGFHKTENPSPPCGMKNLFKNTFPLDEN